MNEIALSENNRPANSPEGIGPSIDRRLTTISLGCSVLQIIGLACMIAEIPGIPSAAGLAAVIMFGIQWARKQSPGWLMRLYAVAAVCGVMIIASEASRAF